MPYKDYEKQKENSRQNYYKNQDKKKQQAREYYYKKWEENQLNRSNWIKAHPDKVKASKEKYLHSPKGKLAVAKSKLKWKNNPANSIKTKAYYHIRKALKKGIIKKPLFCEECGAKKLLYAHHYNGYKDNFLTVKWLCYMCHHKQHYGQHTNLA